jgi:hypothetical protein
MASVSNLALVAAYSALPTQMHFYPQHPLAGTFYVESEARPLLLAEKKSAELASTSLVPPSASTKTKRRNYLWATEPLSDDLNNPNLQ